MFPVLVPGSGFGDESVRVLAWFVTSGQHVADGQLLVEVDGSKATLEIYAPAEGYVWCRGDLDHEVPAGEAICYITESPEPPAAALATRAAQAAHFSGEELPLARLSRFAAELAQASGLDLTDFEGGTLVRSQDVLARIEHSDAVKRTSGAAQQKGVTVPGVPLCWQKLPPRKQATARVLAGGRTGSVQTSITVPYPVAELRSKVAEPTAAIIFDVARLLRQYPHFNAVYSDGRAGLYDEVNIGWALDDGESLAVPVVRNADRMSLTEIEEETRNFAADYVGNRLTAKTLAGATFTISDLSGMGVSLFAPLISRGQSAVLGLGSSTLTLSFDHQLADGRAAACFLRDLCTRLNAYSGDDPATRLSQLCCSFCGYGAAELKANKAFLLRCELPSPGYVCSLCLFSY